MSILCVLKNISWSEITPVFLTGSLEAKATWLNNITTLGIFALKKKTENSLHKNLLENLSGISCGHKLYFIC